MPQAGISHPRPHTLKINHGDGSAIVRKIEIRAGDIEPTTFMPHRERRRKKELIKRRFFTEVVRARTEPSTKNRQKRRNTAGTGHESARTLDKPPLDFKRTHTPGSCLSRHRPPNLNQAAVATQRQYRHTSWPLDVSLTLRLGHRPDPTMDEVPPSAGALKVPRV